MKNNNNILIIGAGASGLAAAVAAARSGASVTVLEHNSESGRKLLITGNGRCNYTNTDISSSHYAAGVPGFARRVLEGFGSRECVDFFSELGVKSIIKHYEYDNNGYVYPLSEDAHEIRDALFNAALRLGADFRFNTDAKLLKDPFRNEYGEFDTLILAAGSNAHPETGSDSSIYPLIKRLGLSFNSFLPALCALYSKDPCLKELKGKRVKTGAFLYIDGTLSGTRYGEVQFNAHSISGIPVMDLSGSASRALKDGREVILVTDGHEFMIHRTAGFDRSQSCTGGLDVRFICPETLESRQHPRVFAAGELLDVSGDCGGFNLHFAFASGIKAAGYAASKHYNR